MGHRRILFVHGLDADCRARDVAHEFERYGRVARCDVPARPAGSRSTYAFVEFEDSRDAEDAYYELHGKRFAYGILKIQWAKRPPSLARDRNYDNNGGRRSSPSTRRERGNSPSPRRGRSRSPRPASPSPRHNSPTRSPSPHRNSPSRSPSPQSKSVSKSPVQSSEQLNNGNNE